MTNELLAKQEIAELHYKYAKGVDQQDWATFRSVFHDHVVFDYSRWGMGERTELSGDDFTSLVQHLFSTQGLVTQHYMTNILIDVDGDSANGGVYVFARHKIGEQVMSLNAKYECEYVKAAEAWKIATITMIPRWDEGADVVSFFQLPDPTPSDKAYLFVTATPILEHHDALERYVGGIIPMLIQAGGSPPMIIKQDESIVGHTDTFMSMIVTFPDAASAEAARAIFDTEEYAGLVADRDKAFSKMNIAFYSDMPGS
ncbi:MAG: nuclear transport factor 2 family protein [Myxococcota bacterium]